MYNLVYFKLFYEGCNRGKWMQNYKSKLTFNRKSTGLVFNEIQAAKQLL